MFVVDEKETSWFRDTLNAAQVCHAVKLTIENAFNLTMDNVTSGW